MSDALDSLESVLGHRFSRRDLLEQALVHTSTRGNRSDSYERLEFLGDRVLGLAVAELLFESYPKEEEGALAKRFTALVKGETLARVARVLGLGAYIQLSPSEDEAGGRDNPSILADVCEAVLAALYLDGGLDVAKAVVKAQFTALMAEDLRPPKDAKTTLQEWAQGRGLVLPDYVETGRSGPPHAPTFEVSVTVEGEPPTTASGASKRAAEQLAAEALLARLDEEKK